MNRWPRRCQGLRRLRRGQRPEPDLREMAPEREQDCGHDKCHVHPSSRAKQAALEIAAQAHDDGVDDDAVNRDRGDGRRESHDERNEYRDVTRASVFPPHGDPSWRMHPSHVRKRRLCSSHSGKNIPHEGGEAALYEPPLHRNENLPGTARAYKGARVRSPDQQRRRGARRQFGSVRSRCRRLEAWHAESSCRARQQPVARPSSVAGRARRIPGPRPLHHALLVRDQAGDRESRPDLELHDGAGEGPGAR